MRYSIQQLYDLAKSSGLAVLGHDGLPFTSLVSADQYYFLHDEERKEHLDLEEFFLKCVPRVAWCDMVAGECEIHEVDGVKWIGCDVYVWGPGDTLQRKLMKLEKATKMKHVYEDRQQEFVEYRFVKDGCPEDAAKKEDWESMVEAFYEGDEAVAHEEFQMWLGRRDTERLPTVDKQ